VAQTNGVFMACLTIGQPYSAAPHDQKASIYSRNVHIFEAESGLKFPCFTNNVNKDPLQGQGLGFWP